MRPVLIFVILLSVGCSAEPQPPWPEVKNKLIGASYEDVVSCAGVPDNLTTVSEGTGAVLYRRYDVRTASTCEATLVVKQGRVTGVTQNEVDANSSYTKIVWPNQALCSKRFENCSWAR